MWAAIINWLTGSLVGQLTKAYEAKLAASNETERLVADVMVEDIKRQMADRAAAKEIRLATAGFWEMRALTAIIGGCAALHMLLVTLDTCFNFSWSVSAYPKPFDEWEGVILLSFFGVQAIGQGFGAISAAIRGRK